MRKRNKTFKSRDEITIEVSGSNRNLLVTTIQSAGCNTFQARALITPDEATELAMNLNRAVKELTKELEEKKEKGFFS